MRHRKEGTFSGKQFERKNLRYIQRKASEKGDGLTATLRTRRLGGKPACGKAKRMREPNGDPGHSPGPLSVQAPRARRNARPRLVLAGLSLAAVLALLWALNGAALPLPEAAAPATTTPAPSLTGDGNPARGREAWQAKGCAVCHGAAAEGGRFPGAPQLARTGLDCEQLRRAVRAPRDPSKGMPPYAAEQLSDAGINDICAWIGSLR